jgi:hypothetical protein
LLVPAVEERGVHAAGDQQRDADLPPGLRGQRPCEAHHPELQGAVRRGVPDCLDAEGGGDRHHRAGAGEERRERGAHHRRGAEQVDRDDAVPLRAGQVAEAGRGVRTGGGDHGVQAPDPVNEPSDGVLGGPGVGQVDHLVLDVRDRRPVQPERATTGGADGAGDRGTQPVGGTSDQHGPDLRWLTDTRAGNPAVQGGEECLVR